MQRCIGILGLAAFASLVGACSSDDSQTPAQAQARAGGGNGGEVVTAGRDAGCAAGSERCACYGNGTCDQGLTCASDLCVRLDGGGGQAAGGAGGVVGSGGAGGTGVAGSSGAATGGVGGQVSVGGTGGTSGAVTGGTPGASGAATGGAPGGANSGGAVTGGAPGGANSGGAATGGAPGGASSGGAATGGAPGGANSGGAATGGAPGGANSGGAATGGAPGEAGAGTGGAPGGSAGVAGNGGSGGIRIITETEINDSWSLPDDLGHGSVIVLASLMGSDPEDPGNDVETFKFTLTAPRSDVEIRAFSGSPPSTSCDGLHLRFDLYKATDTTAYYAEDYHSYIGECTSLAWQDNPLLRGLPAGQYYLRITVNESNPAPVPAYYLQLLVDSECGDGVVSGSEQCDSSAATCNPTTCQRIATCGDGVITPPETCEDGNTTNGDGCSSTCQREPRSEVEINNTMADADARAANDNVVIRGDAYYMGTIVYSTDETDVYRVELTEPRVVRFETFETTGTDFSYDCSIDARHQLKLYDSSGFALVSDSHGFGIEYCSAFAIGLDPGTYYAEFSHTQSTTDAPPYRLEADFQDDVGSEAEPNDTVAQATPLTGSSVVVHGTFSSSTDVDYYGIQVPPGFSVRAQVLPWTINGVICDGLAGSYATDTVLQLLDSQGIVVAYNDNWRFGCSSFDGTGANREGLYPNAWNPTATTQTYYLAVAPKSGPPGYRLSVTVRP